MRRVFEARVAASSGRRNGVCEWLLKLHTNHPCAKRSSPRFARISDTFRRIKDFAAPIVSTPAAQVAPPSDTALCVDMVFSQALRSSVSEPIAAVSHIGAIDCSLY